MKYCQSPHAATPRAANLQSDSEKASYLYVFKHTTESGYYPEHGGGGVRSAANNIYGIAYRMQIHNVN